MKNTLIAIITLGTITLTQASAGDCNDGRSRYSYSSGYTRYYAPRPQYRYVPSYHYDCEPRYTDRHHSYAAPRRDSHGHRVDSHGHHVDSQGRHRR